MATTARLDLSIWRNDEVYDYPLRVVGVNLASVGVDLQARAQEDAPGPPLISLTKADPSASDGLIVMSVTIVDGQPVSDLRIRLSKAPRQALPYQGEIGAPAIFHYALRIGGETRLVGRMIVLPHAFGSDAAPLKRLPPYPPNPTGLPTQGSTLTIAGVNVTELRIDGAGMTDRAERAAIRAEAAAVNAGYGNSVATYSDLAAIPADRRVEGMPVYVRDVGLEYRLRADLQTWYDANEPIRNSMRTLLFDWRPGASVVGTNGVELRLATASDMADAKRRTTAQVDASREQAKAEVRDLVPDWLSGAGLVGTNGQILRLATAGDMKRAARKVAADIDSATRAATEEIRAATGDWQAGIGVVGTNGGALRLVSFADLGKSEERVNRRVKGIVTPLFDRSGRRHIVIGLGDSRVDAVTIDGLPGTTQLRYGAASGLNCANALIGGRLTVLPDFGISGQRTDEIAKRIDAAIATGAGTLYLMCGVNDIAQNYPTAETSGTIAFQNIRAMAEKAVAAGMIAVVELEVGANSLTAGQWAQIEELNAQLIDWAEGARDIYLCDVRGEMMNPAAGGTTFRAGYSYDGTHEAPRGSFVHGRILAKLFAQLILPRPTTARAAIQLPAYGRRQLLENPLFVSTSGGLRSGDVGGDVPGSWTVRASSGATVVLSSRADPEGVGNNLILSITFSAAGDEIYLTQDVALNKWFGGDIVQASLVAELLEATTALGLISVVGSNVVRRSQSTEAQRNFADGDGLIADAPGLHQPALLTLRGRPATLLAAEGTSWLAISARIRACAAGTVRIAIRSLALNRRITSY